MLFSRRRRTQFREDTLATLVVRQWTEHVSFRVRNIDEWEVRELYLSQNDRPTIVKEISHITFTILNLLQLGWNNIDSIEGLPRIPMPYLQKLYLYNNNIICLKEVRKAAWPNLQQFCINGNHFGDGQHLVEGNFPQMKSLSFYEFQPADEHNPFTEQCFVGKLQAFLQCLCIRQNKFCFDRSIRRASRRKFPRVHIYRESDHTSDFESDGSGLDGYYADLEEDSSNDFEQKKLEGSGRNFQSDNDSDLS